MTTIIVPITFLWRIISLHCAYDLFVCGDEFPFLRSSLCKEPRAVSHTGEPLPKKKEHETPKKQKERVKKLAKVVSWWFSVLFCSHFCWGRRISVSKWRCSQSPANRRGGSRDLDISLYGPLVSVSFYTIVRLWYLSQITYLLAYFFFYCSKPAEARLSVQHCSASAL